MNSSFAITIDGTRVQVSENQIVLSAARGAGFDIPALCYLEKCGPLNSCLVCLVKINGKLVPSCGTKVQPGMTVESETEEVHAARRTALELLFSDHVGDCLSPCQRLCPLGLNVPVMIRHIRAGELDEATQTVRDALPLAGVLGRLCHHPCEQGCRRGSWDDPAAIRDMERFVTDREFLSTAHEAASQTFPPRSANIASLSMNLSHDRPERELSRLAAATENRERGSAAEPTGAALRKPLSLPKQPVSGKAVAIIGGGPTGLAAASHLVRLGHAVTIVDRQDRLGGSLRRVPQDQLPSAVLDVEVALLLKMGIEPKLGVELGHDVTIDGLCRGFDAILVATGELTPAEAERAGLPLAGSGLKSDPNSFETPLRKVFAAGPVVKPAKQLVRAMAEGRATAECVHRFLSGLPARRPGKVFSSVMGRLEMGELRQFLATANPGGCVTPCDRCAGLNSTEAVAEAGRCLHCDCRASGNCLLQHYAQVYGSEAGRYRSERRGFEQQIQPGGVVFEPGKCILCGICVKLTEMAREPLGLTFIGRGFDVRIGAPLNASIQEGLQKVAHECIKHCPTGALEWFSESDT